MLTDGENRRDPTSKPFKMIMGKPEGWAVELVDCMIRILDTMAEQQINIDYLMKLKMDYNENRPYRHGGKKA